MKRFTAFILSLAILSLSGCYYEDPDVTMFFIITEVEKVVQEDLGDEISMHKFYCERTYADITKPSTLINYEPVYTAYYKLDPSPGYPLKVTYDTATETIQYNYELTVEIGRVLEGAYDVFPKNSAFNVDVRDDGNHLWVYTAEDTLSDELINKLENEVDGFTVHIYYAMELSDIGDLTDGGDGCKEEHYSVTGTTGDPGPFMDFEYIEFN